MSAILTHHFAVPTLALQVHACPDSATAVLHLGVDDRSPPDLSGFPSALEGIEVVLLVEDGVRLERVVKTIDALAQRRATIVLQGHPASAPGRTDRCRR